MKIAPLIFLGIMSSTPVSADILIHAASWHFGQKGFNQENAGLGWRGGGDRWMISAGGYRNSLDRRSYYVSAGARVAKFGPLELNLQAGAVSGYTDTWVPAVVPEIAIDLKRVKVVISYLPRIDSIGVAEVLGLTFQIK